MKNSYKTLIVEDHGLIAKGVKTILNEITESTGTTFEIHYASKCSQAIAILKDEPIVDLVFLDIKLPKEPEIGMVSGEDLGEEIRALYPSTLIVVVTAHNRPIIIDRIMNKLAPEGFFVKGDAKVEELPNAIKKVLQDPPYYSATVMKYITNLKYNNLTLEELDIQLLKALDKGLTMAQIGIAISLSTSAVSKRKRKLKVLLGVEGGNNRDLVNRAQELCFF